MNDEIEVIFAYTRAQAIKDGVLVDVSKMAKEAGFRYPVALTQAVYVQYVEVPDGVDGQDKEGRLWDILNMFRFELQKTRNKGKAEIFFRLYVQNDNRKLQLVTLKAVCGPNDDTSPCLTVMMRDED